MRYLLIAVMLLGLSVVSAAAQTAETVKVEAGKQASAQHGKVRIKFIEVVEDSRCPVGVACVWAGNAKVKAEVSYKGKKKIVELNTGIAERSADVDVWTIELVSLMPRRTKEAKPGPVRYVAAFTITQRKR